MSDCKGVPKSVPKGGGKSVCNSVPMSDGKCVRTGVRNIVGNCDGLCGDASCGKIEPRLTVSLCLLINLT